MFIVDSHCHINFPDFDNRLDELLQQARDNDVHHMLCISTSWENAAEVRQLSLEHDAISASFGIHPNTKDGHEPDLEEIVEKASDAEIVAVGETGLDYHWNEGDLRWQHERFERHITAAKTVQKPLIIHTRSAAEDTMQKLESLDAGEAGGVMHCFAEDWAIAKRALDIGFYISFSGIVTFKSAKAVQEVASKAPLDRILVETDAPFLAPVPFRGKQNQPAYVRHTAEHVAELRGIPLPDLAQATTDNYFELFSLSKRNAV